MTTPDTNRPTRRARVLPIVAAIVLALLAGALGFRIGERASSSITESTSPPYLNPDYVTKAPEDVDPDDFVTIRSAEDVAAARQQMIELLWGQSALPDKLPTVESSFLDQSVSDRLDPVAASVDTLVVTMDAGLVTRALHFTPREGNGDVVILHDGHDGSFIQREVTIETLLAKGYGVIALSMPLVSPNSQPELTLPTGETIRLQRHDQLGFLNPEHGHPVRYFIEPVIQLINFVELRTSYQKISMSGISGGGWTTVLAAAIDPRVSVSVPIAGSFPIYLRALNDRDWGDWEQTLPALYSQIGYLDLYALGSAGAGRRQVQVFYEHDPCCYAGRAATSYERAVQEAVTTIGSGSFDVQIDSEYGGHGISPFALETILASLDRSNVATAR